MVGTYYKGDVSEVLMGHETGIYIEHGEPKTWSTSWSAGNDYTTITFVDLGGAGAHFNADAILKVPTGMLVGCKLTFHGSGGNHADYYYEKGNSKVFTIVDHTITATATILKVTPAYYMTASTIASSAGDAILIHSTGLPTPNPTYADWAVHINNAATAAETSLIDQFIGLASFMTLPDTKVEVHQHHVVGLGRQPTILQPGRLHHTGGTLEMPLHSPRWLYYALGREVVDAPTMIAAYAKTSNLLAGSTIQPGQTYVDMASATFTDVTVAVGDYVLIKDNSRVPTVYHKHSDETNAAGNNIWWPISSTTNHADFDSEAKHFESTETHEIRRVIATEALSSGIRLFIDDPFHFAHAQSEGDVGYLFRFDAAALTGSPNVNSDRTITNPVKRLLFSGDTIPSFCLEHSIRNRDVGSYSQESGPAPGGATDSKQLTRVFRGCKIAEWEISSTVDAELKFRAVFDALSCYTDMGRLETTAGDRYTAHRMFQNVGDTDKSRKEAGIANGSEKPYMFYNGTLEMFGQSLGNIAAFELRGKTGVEMFHTIQGNPIPDTVDANGRSTKPVPYGGTRNASIIREGREEFEMDIDVIIGDHLLWNELRTQRNVQGTTGATGSIINLHFTKPTSGTTGSTPELRILVDDYVIKEAPIPIPDDKGLLVSKVKLVMKNVKVISLDTLFHC